MQPANLKTELLSIVPWPVVFVCAFCDPNLHHKSGNDCLADPAACFYCIASTTSHGIHTTVWLWAELSEFHFQMQKRSCCLTKLN